MSETGSDLVTAEMVDRATAAASESGALFASGRVRAALVSVAADIVAKALEDLAAHYPADIFTEDGTSRDAIAGTALRTVLTAQARYWRDSS